MADRVLVLSRRPAHLLADVRELNQGYVAELFLSVFCYSNGSNTVLDDDVLVISVVFNLHGGSQGRNNATVQQKGSWAAAPLNVEDHLTSRSAAANKRVSLCRRIQRLRIVFHVAGNQRCFAGVADPGSTGPSHSHIACFCKFEEAPVLCIPRQRESAPREGNLWS